KLNEIIFVYLIALSIIQPILQNIWLDKDDYYKDMSVLVFISTILPLFLLESSLYIISIVFIFSRILERYIYIHNVKNNCFNKMQVYVIYIFTIELFLV